MGKVRVHEGLPAYVVGDQPFYTEGNDIYYKKGHYDRFGSLGENNPFASVNVNSTTDFFDAMFGFEAGQNQILEVLEVH